MITPTSLRNAFCRQTWVLIEPPSYIYIYLYIYVQNIMPRAVLSRRTAANVTGKASKYRLYLIVNY
ncbi:hypothetical protein GDO81_007643 [Engystomops pustulosus]|uniref:Uncharacterized protein n=1 Tax=Engystomops pustulosus TaxID=76066 RepID=A0AAV7C9N3_ENGPU|nr:hypothetical protein GDO81_007643 [Engystomops pustulosus]KAG8581341.1 hypothetical protein GDO81_007643 [Engystomops pustulosus]